MKERRHTRKLVVLMIFEYGLSQSKRIMVHISTKNYDNGFGYMQKQIKLPPIGIIIVTHIRLSNYMVRWTKKWP
jgi:hypothetical protein